MYCVIMAGGIGKRFWPQSRRNRPKQLLSIVSDQSMLRVTYERLKKITSIEKIYIVAGQVLREPTLKELEEFPEENFIMEPFGRNTAPCIGLTASIIKKKDPNATIGVFPADHLIGNPDNFVEAVKVGAEIAHKKKALVTFGVNPTHPATGYGYVQFDQTKEAVKGKVYKVKTFAEKPNLSTAKRFIKSNEFLWNSGMFVWKVSSILSSIKHYLPGVHESLQNISKAINTPEYLPILKKEWAKIHSISIDYGVMEKSRNVYVVRGDFQWSDVGSWDAVYDLKEKDDKDNVIIGNIKTIDTEGCYIQSEKHLISTIGLKDLIIIESKGAILIANRNDTEKVKDIVNHLKNNDQDDYL